MPSIMAIADRQDYPDILAEQISIGPKILNEQLSKTLVCYIHLQLQKAE